MKFYLSFLFLLILTAHKGICQDGYAMNLDIARSMYYEHEFLKSAQFYTKAFLSNNNLGRADHRVEAARSWALAGNKDSAFYQLERSVKGNYAEYLQLSNDTAFSILRDDDRWIKIIKMVKLNEYRNDSLTNLQYPNLNHHLITILDTIFNDDQLPRLEIPLVEKQYGWNTPKMKELTRKINKLDSINQLKVSSILQQYGWPGKELVGEKGNHAIFLVIQHSSIAFQKRYLTDANKALVSGKLRPSSYALLMDRMALAEGRLQTYGTQISRNLVTGKYFVRPLVDPANVDQRRSKVALGPMKDYVSQWGINWSVEDYKKGLER